MSTEAATKAESGVEAFKESMAAIQRIRTNSDESANSIRFLSEKTESIEHILDVIDDISNRTRLLSLNASIIASHAGEAGRGFMIVADEIKDLASRTAGSTREIAKIINEVRDGSEGAIEVVERGVRAVNEGVKRAEFAGEVLSQIVASTNQTGSLVERISNAMNRQAAGTKQVSNAMRDVHSVVVRVREVVGTQKNESRDLEASIRTMRIQMSRATATAKQQMGVIQEAIKAISFIFQQIQLISNFNTDQVRNQQSVSKAVDKLKNLSDLHHASADNLSVAVEQSNRQSKLVRDGLKSFRI
jgi:methyl-accepting chemotaxis protein